MYLEFVSSISSAKSSRSRDRRDGTPQTWDRGVDLGGWAAASFLRQFVHVHSTRMIVYTYSILPYAMQYNLLYVIIQTYAHLCPRTLSVISSRERAHASLLGWQEIHARNPKSHTRSRCMQSRVLAREIPLLITTDWSGVGLLQYKPQQQQPVERAPGTA